MKAATKGFLLGLVCGIALTIAAATAGFIGLGLLMTTSTARQWMGDHLLGTPRMPDLSIVPKLGRPDPDWTLHSLDGEALRFSDLSDRVVFLNVWATWCGPCVMELASIERLHASLDGAGVAFVLVSLEDAELVRKFAEQRPVSVPLYVTEELPRALAGDSVPATFIIASGGTIVFRHVGAAKWDGETVRTFLRELAGPASPALEPAGDGLRRDASASRAGRSRTARRG